jgi:hypothetical protein
MLAAEATGLALLRAVLPSTTRHLPFAARGIASSSARAAATESEKRAQKKAAENAERVGGALSFLCFFLHRPLSKLTL